VLVDLPLIGQEHRLGLGPQSLRGSGVPCYSDQSSLGLSPNLPTGLPSASGRRDPEGFPVMSRFFGRGLLPGAAIIDGLNPAHVAL
jgi:hypothetical protein